MAAAKSGRKQHAKQTECLPGTAVEDKYTNFHSAGNSPLRIPGEIVLFAVSTDDTLPARLVIPLGAFAL